MVTTPQVLIVDDSTAVTQWLQERIRQVCGVECAVAGTLAAAERVIRTAEPQFPVAVLDLNLPDARDEEVIQRVQAAGIAVIVLTGSEDAALRRSLLDQGVSDYVRKDSVGVDYVARQVRRMLRSDALHILVVDDSRSYRQYLSGRLRQHGYRVSEARDGAEALELVRGDDRIAMVITDYHMPNMDGLQMTAALRRFKSFDELAIIALSQSGGPELLAQFLRGGASDFLHKSFSTEELFCRVDRNIDALLSLAEARHASNHDYLTGLPNRRDFMRRAARFHEQARSGSHSLVLAMLDADHFKRINDEFGHHVGDLALIAMAGALREASLPEGLCARMGGEEFVLLLPDMTEKDAQIALENLRLAVSRLVVDADHAAVRFTVSIGATMKPGASLDEMVDRADAALYQAKSDGRNRVVMKGAADG